MEAIFEGFSDADDVFNDFEVPESEREGIEILFAVYDRPPYEGYAFVLYRDENGKLFEVHGGHCSCRGLEGQWTPEDTSIDALKYRLDNGMQVGESNYTEQLREIVDTLMQ